MVIVLDDDPDDQISDNQKNDGKNGVKYKRKRTFEIKKQQTQMKISKLSLKSKKV